MDSNNSGFSEARLQAGLFHILVSIHINHNLLVWSIEQTILKKNWKLPNFQQIAPEERQSMTCEPQLNKLLSSIISNILKSSHEVSNHRIL